MPGALNQTRESIGMNNIQVFAIRILAFSTRLGQLVPMDLSRMKPERAVKIYLTIAKKGLAPAFVKI
jgi:hypothetical protein